MSSRSLSIAVEPARASPTLLRQILVVAAVFLGLFIGMGLSGLRVVGPTAIVAALATAIFVLKRNGEAPAEALGLLPMPRWRALLLAVGCLVCGYLAAAIATVAAVRGFDWAPVQSAAFGAIRGNGPLLLGMLAIAWSTAAFGEELLFRGFLQGRLHTLFGGGRTAGVAAAALQSLLFGFAHAYQGPTGVLVSASIGLVFGLLYLRLRSLWPLIVAHGVIDTIGLIALYAGVVPGA